VVAETRNSLEPVAPSTPEIEARFRALHANVNGGDQKAAKELLALCDAQPMLWQGLGDLQVQAEQSWLHAFVSGDSPRDVFQREMLRQGAEQRRRELSKGGRSPLERLLIDRIILGWYQMAYAEMKLTQALDDPSASVERLEFNQKRVDRAQRQLLRATQALATVRRLVTPTQINVGQNQVNIAEATIAAPGSR
jgi:hypothetical protein